MTVILLSITGASKNTSECDSGGEETRKGGLAAAPSSEPESRRGVFTLRSLLIGLAFTIANVWWVTLVEVRYYILDGSSLPLFVTPVFLLLLLVLANGALSRLSPRAALGQAEMITVYFMTVISTVFASHDLLQNFFGWVTHPFYFSKTEGGWQEMFLRYVPSSLFVTDPETLERWYRGNVPAGQAIRYAGHFLVPLALWGAFFLTLVFMFLCAAVLFRKAWTENERLAFPIIQLPLAMTEPGAPLFKNRLMWTGFAIAFSIGLLNGIHELYPTVPNAPWIKLFDIGQFFTTQPWEAIRTYGMHTNLYPFAIGLAYFIPLDLAFSCWFSYLLSRGYLVAGRAMAWDAPSAGQGWPFVKELSAGSWLGLAAAILWANRKYLRRAFDAAFPSRDHGTAQDADSADPAEARRYRFAFIGLFVGSLLLIGWSRYLGVHPLVAIGFFGILFGLSLAITRVRAEFGVPHEIFYAKPGDTMVILFGPKALGPENLVGMQTMYWFNRGYRSHPMPNLLESLKMGEESSGLRGAAFPFMRLVGVILIACVASLVATYAANYFVTFEAGGKSKATGYKWWIGQESFGPVQNWLRYGQPSHEKNLYFLAGGLGMVGLLAYLRTAFIWWPLHPAGFALGISYAMNYFWMCVFVAWLTKFVIIRYGGMKTHRQVIPFFLGLILGDYTIGSLWSLLALYLQTPTYRIYI